MKSIPIKNAVDLGMAIRAVRKASGLRQDDLAGSQGVSTRFASEVEHGKSTAQVGKVLQLMESLGMRLCVEIPESAGDMLKELTLRYAALEGRHQRRSPRKTSASAAAPGKRSAKASRGRAK